MSRLPAASLRREGFKSYRVDKITGERVETHNQLCHYAAWLRKRPAYIALSYHYDLGVVRMHIVPYKRDTDTVFHYAERPMTVIERKGGESDA